MALVAAVLPAPTDEDLAEMGRCYVEEFARMGWSEDAVMRVFCNPFYRGPHAVYRRKGEQFVRGAGRSGDRRGWERG